MRVNSYFFFGVLTLIGFLYLFKSHIHWHECKGGKRNEQPIEELSPLILQIFLLIFLIHQLLTVPGFLFVSFLRVCFFHEYFTNRFLTLFPVHQSCCQGNSPPVCTEFWSGHFSIHSWSYCFRFPFIFPIRASL